MVLRRPETSATYRFIIESLQMLDEPLFSRRGRRIIGMDPQGRREVMDTVLELNREKGITVVLITHHMDEAARADRVIAMSEGRIVADGTPQAVFAQEPLLRSVGLDVPQTEQLLLELKRRGVDIPTDALTPEACAQLLRQRIARS